MTSIVNLFSLINEDEIKKIMTDGKEINFLDMRLYRTSHREYFDIILCIDFRKKFCQQNQKELALKYLESRIKKSKSALVESDFKQTDFTFDRTRTHITCEEDAQTFVINDVSLELKDKYIGITNNIICESMKNSRQLITYADEYIHAPSFLTSHFHGKQTTARVYKFIDDILYEKKYYILEINDDRERKIAMKKIKQLATLAFLKYSSSDITKISSYNIHGLLTEYITKDLSDLVVCYLYQTIIVYD